MSEHSAALSPDQPGATVTILYFAIAFFASIHAADSPVVPANAYVSRMTELHPGVTVDDVRAKTGPPFDGPLKG